MRIRDPILQTVEAAELRPTQITVGYREVAAKRRAWRERGQNGAAFLGSHLVPVILGPNEHYYVTDHHHLVRALMEEAQTKIAISTVADLRHLPRDSFWFVLDNRGWMHPYDDEGKRRVSLARRRVAAAGRLRQGHDAVQRVPLGRLSAPPDQAQACRGGVRCRPRRRARAGAVEGRKLPAGLVRPGA
jgi:hypothetical protein